MKKILASLLTFLMVGFNFVPVFAAEKIANDIKVDFWASKEVSFVLNRAIMTTDVKGYFNPCESMTRVEFVHSLLKVLSNENLNVNIKNNFTDVNSNDVYYLDVLRSAQLGLVYGYPDKTFKPDKFLSKAETTSIMSHITKDIKADMSVLNGFDDYMTIPAWAKTQYAKTVAYDLYVNHPNIKFFEPKRNLTRAEAAVLLYKLYNKIHLVKTEYKNTSEVVLATEHLNVNKKAPCNEVTITNLRNVILEGNVLKISYNQKFWSKNAKTGDLVDFVFKNNVYTEEGTLIIPEGSCLRAEVISIQKPKWFNKNARVGMKFRTLTVNGTEYQIDADPFTKDRLLKEGPWMTFAKVAGWTVGLGAVGTGAGIGFGFIPNPAKLGTGIAIGTPIGTSVGLVLGLVTPGLHYKAKCGENLLIILNEDTGIER